MEDFEYTMYSFIVHHFKEISRVCEAFGWDLSEFLDRALTDGLDQLNMSVDIQESVS